MKYIFALLLYIPLFFQVLTDKTIKNEKVHIINESKDKIRKLQATDNSDYESGISTTILDETSNTNSTEREKTTADEASKPVNENTPVSSEIKNLDNKKAAFQITRFANYEIKDQKINFDTFFYLSKKIAQTIYFRLRVTYLNNLRNLEDRKNAESDPCTCYLKNESLQGQNENGKMAEYNCEASILTNAQNIKNVELNTDVPMIVIYENGNEAETISFNKINFNGNSSLEAKSLQNIRKINKTGILEDAEVEYPIPNNYFKLYGSLNPSDSFSVNDVVPISILSKTNGKKGQIAFDCTVTQISPKCGLQCDTENQPIKSRIQDMHLSEGITDNNKLLIIKMKNWKNNVTAVETTEDNVVYKQKSSGGLSKGAIAGIITASVAVLLAATIIAIIIRRRFKAPLQHLNNNSITIQSDTAVRV